MNNLSSLEVIFFAALEKGSPQERAAYLDEACAGDPDCRSHIEKMLAAQAREGSFLETPALAVGATLERRPITEGPGTIIGRYKLLQQIGEGGMGIVYMAEQTHPVQRKVALKVIKVGMDTRQVIARFEAERQALAMMDHANIARVLDVGATESGRPYFVMELVHGLPITKYCDDHQLAPRQRLELFVSVCQAIQHAHQKGIIHRDIKPSNVMVTLYDGKPVPKVIDFGVAKATEQKLTERTLFTQYGTMVGTLEYMSPEQAEMSALGTDTRSDIYSLGVLLYELLTGRTPLSNKRMKEAAYAEILRMIKEEEPPKPSTRLSESGDALVSISAQRDTEPAKLSKLMRGELDSIVMKTLEKDRSRRYETANGFAADVQRYLNDEPVLACPPSAAYRLRKFARRNKRALATAAVVAMALLVAVGTVAGSLGWVARDRTARQAVLEQEVNLALKEAQQLQEQAKWPEALSAAKRAEGLLAGGSSDELSQRARQLRKDAEMVLRLEEIRLLSSEVKDLSFAYEDADRAYAQAFADYGIDVAGLPMKDAAASIRARSGVTVPLAVALDDWANARDAKDQAAGWALATLAQAADPDPWRRKVREAYKQNATKALAALAASPEPLLQPPTSLVVLAMFLRARGLVEAEITVLRQAQGQHPGDFWINFELAVALDELGPSYGDQAISFYRAALAVRPQSIAVYYSLGNVLYKQGKVDEAIACFRKAVELDPKFAAAPNNLGTALLQQRKMDEAIACFRRATELNPKSALFHANLGQALRRQGKLDEAVVCCRKAVELDPKLSLPHTNLGIVLDMQGKVDEAIACFRKAVELDPKFAAAHTHLGNALDQQGKVDEAIACHRKAIELDPKFALAHMNLGLVLEGQGKVDEAIASHKKAILLDPKNARSHNLLAWLLVTCPDPKFRDPNRALELAKKAVELEPKNSTYWQTLGVAHYRAADWRPAIVALEKVKELGSDGDSMEWFPLAMAHWQLGEKDEARYWFDQAVAWMEKNKPEDEELKRFRDEAAELWGVKEK